MKPAMQGEYKIVALGLLVDATEPNQRDKHEQILNELGRGFRLLRAERYSSLKRLTTSGEDRKGSRQRQ